MKQLHSDGPGNCYEVADPASGERGRPIVTELSYALIKDIQQKQATCAIPSLPPGRRTIVITHVSSFHN